ncbi:unnamed protein product [Symbiodinium pilosum]|uniref:Uncharacterized protein n=1 Tax=Symbiodinium pilosum TaxID=2952 RepID=A0A812XDA1_SYMPI|nr:unnamed protein product [Symbiodinium pilosum]
MGCSSSASISVRGDEFGGKQSARVEPVDCSVNFKDGKEVACDYKEAMQSFESMVTCTDGSANHPGRPTKATHKRHVAKLNDFLKQVHEDPDLLNKDVILRRIVEM